MGRKERFVNAYKTLRSKGYVHTQKDVAAKMGASVSNVSSAMNGVESVLTDKFLRRFNDAFNTLFNIDWLLTGEGAMLNEAAAHGNAAATSEKKHTILYYPNVDGTMGGVQFLDNPDETYIEMSIPGYTDCRFAINAYGESMSPLIKSGQIVLLAQWQERFVDWGKIYLVVTRSGYRVIKRLLPGKTETTIVCRSENMEANPDFEIELADILQLYLVKGWVCRDVI